MNFSFMRRLAVIGLVLMVTAVSIPAASAAVLPAHATSTPVSQITLNGMDKGPTFDGIGAISGGGGETRYLSDYPPAERNQIFNDLFEPKYGASLQILKVEIGGDSNTTDGSEPSIEHTQGVINCNAGYEWQFMEEARALNPAIKLYGLAWGAPGWVKSFFSQATINYLISWLGCARQHGLSINYLGGWNEHGFTPSQASWFEDLRAALNKNGYGSVEIVATDGTPTFPKGKYDPYSPWAIATSMAQNAKLDAAVSVVGVHDVCYYPTSGLECFDLPVALKLDKTMWASELGAMNGNSGGADMVRAINRGFIDIDLTGFITWPIMAAMPSGLPHETQGLIYADQPWSGNYQVNQMTWAIAQTTQFTKVGWRYITAASGYFAGNRQNGSYVTYRATSTNNWSLVAETTTASKARQIDVTIKGGLSQGTVEVYATNLRSSNPSQWFMHVANIKPVKGQFQYVLEPGYVYTFSTTTGQSKGGASAVVPKAKDFPLPYTDALNDPDSSLEARYLASMDGAFESTPCLGGIKGTCLEQMVPETPIYWDPHPGYPYAVIGDQSMGNYQVKVDVLFTTDKGSAGVIGRFSKQSTNMAYYDGYMLNVTEAGHWEILQVNAKTNSTTVLASGNISSLGIDKWHSVALSLTGSALVATISGVKVGSAKSSSYASGPAGIEAGAFTGNWPVVQYRHLSITPTQQGKS